MISTLLPFVAVVYWSFQYGVFYGLSEVPILLRRPGSG